MDNCLDPRPHHSHGRSRVAIVATLALATLPACRERWEAEAQIDRDTKTVQLLETMSREGPAALRLALSEIAKLSPSELLQGTQFGPSTTQETIASARQLLPQLDRKEPVPYQAMLITAYNVYDGMCKRREQDPSQSELTRAVWQLAIAVNFEPPSADCDGTPIPRTGQSTKYGAPVVRIK